jgi:translocation and assembly module TamB
LGLSRLAVQITAVDNQLSATLDVAGSTLGFVTTSMQSTLTRKGDAWGMSGDTTLSLQADAGMPSIAWAAPLLGKHVEIDGAAKARLHAQGTVREPKLTGEVMLDNFSFDYPEYGIGFKQGSLLASMRDNRLLIDRFELRGGEGDLSGNGSIAWESGKPDMKIALVANKLEVLSRPDRLLILSGSGEASVREGRVNVAAKLKADRGLIELPEADAPSLSEDVVVLGRSDAAEKKKTPYAITMDIELDLGEQFYLKGKGVDVQLAGAVKVHATGESVPTAAGIIRVAKGNYSAYGQRLAIERGILNFAGPIDNPGLNIVALRKNMPVEAGVAISGTAQLPQVRLTSVPSVPDSEKLSWLVLGHGLENTSGGEFSLLQTAAGALLAQGESVSLETRIAHAAGLDEFALSGKGGVESTVLTLGKRLSTRAYLSFEQGLTGASNLAKINYTLTQRLSVRAQTGTESAMDLFYTFSFD